MTATVYLKNGLSFIPTSEAALDLHQTLPVGNYIVKTNPATMALYFEQVDSFNDSGKKYGNTTRHAERIINTFLNRSVSTGVLLTGEKGSGKTLLAKTLSQEAALLGFPTIIINAAYHGDGFNQLIQTLTQPAVILFDEFEKVYDRDEQKAVLTLMDGVFPSKKMFVLTCNDKYRIDEHMRNRPGRIFYMIDFNGLDSAFITEYCNDNLIDKSHIDTICKIGMLFAQFNFDMLKALVEEMNRYNEDPHAAMEMLNAKPQSDDGGIYDVSVKIDNIDIPKPRLGTETWHGTPIGKDFQIEIFNDAECSGDSTYVVIVANDLKDINLQEGSFSFANAEGQIVKFKRRSLSKFDWTNAL